MFLKKESQVSLWYRPMLIFFHHVIFSPLAVSSCLLVSYPAVASLLQVASLRYPPHLVEIQIYPMDHIHREQVHPMHLPVNYSGCKYIQ